MSFFLSHVIVNKRALDDNTTVSIQVSEIYSENKTTCDAQDGQRRHVLSFQREEWGLGSAGLMRGLWCLFASTCVSNACHAKRLVYTHTHTKMADFAWYRLYQLHIFPTLQQHNSNTKPSDAPCLYSSNSSKVFPVPLVFKRVESPATEAWFSTDDERTLYPERPFMLLGRRKSSVFVKFFNYSELRDHVEVQPRAVYYKISWWWKSRWRLPETPRRNTDEDQGEAGKSGRQETMHLEHR